MHWTITKNLTFSGLHAQYWTECVARWIRITAIFSLKIHVWKATGSLPTRHWQNMQDNVGLRNGINRLHLQEIERKGAALMINRKWRNLTGAE